MDMDPGADSLAPQEDDRRIINMSELAYILGMSLPTLRDKVQRSPTFPITKRGDKGVDYEFDLDSVQAWLDEENRAKADEAEARRQQLDLWASEIYGQSTLDDPGPTLSPQERKAFGEAIRVEDYNRERRRELLEKAALETTFDKALSLTQKRLRQIAPTFARETGIDRDLRIRLENVIRQIANDLVDDLVDYLPAEKATDADRDAA